MIYVVVILMCMKDVFIDQLVALTWHIRYAVMNNDISDDAPFELGTLIYCIIVPDMHFSA